MPFRIARSDLRAVGSCIPVRPTPGTSGQNSAARESYDTESKNQNAQCLRHPPLVAHLYLSPVWSARCCPLFATLTSTSVLILAVISLSICTLIVELAPEGCTKMRLMVQPQGARRTALKSVRNNRAIGQAYFVAVEVVASVEVLLAPVVSVVAVPVPVVPVLLDPPSAVPAVPDDPLPTFTDPAALRAASVCSPWVNV